MNELKPCPFCGKPGKIIQHTFSGFNDSYGVECTGCRAQTYQFCNSIEEAVNKWNERQDNG